MHKRDAARAFAAAAFMLLAPAALAQQTTLAPRDVPAKTIPVPGDVSPQLQAVIAHPLRSGWNTPPTTPQGWQQMANSEAEAAVAVVEPMAKRLHVKITQGTIDGVHVYRVTPETIPARDAKRLLIHVHGGCYVLNPGEAALPEAVLMAGFSHIPVISVDYRMPPTAYFPAALDDAMTVYKAALKMEKPQDIGVFGGSAGGALTLEMMLRAKQEHLPMPGAIDVNTPMADAVDWGDSSRTNALVDNVLVSPSGFCESAALFYAHGHDMADPMISPLNGDFHGFPPTILLTGTRDLLLSNTVRTEQKLLQSGVPANLLVFEGMSHFQFTINDQIPEDRQAFTELAAFLNRHLGH
ncbi:MAG TPA: alpha/beta hydrolase [Acidocella sp.]|jgi:monoterpene epsilon-lactone hydrolase|uniref:alpha/beta hydrolase n=1 Tax=Acidocella sp. TaxID=50710 RepID=UPI002C3814FF|nr:alpha/beta hydrolase [Acidocella sp.]HVE20948.1 alpha/beta hydrolase [Acidocella sp.]